MHVYEIFQMKETEGGQIMLFLSNTDSIQLLDSENFLEKKKTASPYFSLESNHGLRHSQKNGR